MLPLSCGSGDKHFSMTNLLPSFRLWLQNKNYSDSTVRNYLVDIRKYLDSTSADSIFQRQSLANYLQSVATDVNLARILSSLNKFCQFAYSQNLVSENPLKPLAKHLKNTHQTTIDTVISDFQEHLFKHHHSNSTVRNYINDVHQYISWLENPIEPQ